MNRSQFAVVLVTLAVLLGPSGTSAEPPSKEQIERELPQGAKLRAVESRMVGGKELTFVKFEGPDGSMKEQNFEGKTKIREEQLPKPQKKWISDDLQALLDSAGPGEKIKVEVGLLVDTIDDEGEPLQGTVDIAGEKEAKEPKLTLNGKAATAKEVHERKLQRVEANKAKGKANREKAEARLNKVREAHGLGGLAGIKEALENEAPTVVLELTKGQIIALAAQSKGEIQGIHPWKESKDALDSAMPSSYISPWAINYAGRKGEGMGIYFTECGCPDTGVISNYMRLGGTDSNHSRNVGGILRGVSPASYIYCKTSGPYCSDPILPSASERGGVGGNPPIHVINQSNGQLTGSAYTPKDRDYDNYTYDHGIPIFVSPGNEGGNLRSPSKGLNTISTGAYDDGNNTIADFSSYIESEIGSAKPEFSAPGVNITAGGLSNYSGTSMSSPHAAAFAADLMGAYSWYRYRPYYLKAHMIASAWRAVNGGFDKVGQGGIDFYGAYYNASGSWWEGGNGSFTFPVENQWVYIPAGRTVRITLSWLNRGTWTYDHRYDAHPIGMDLDLEVYAPSGAWVASSSSWDNPFETVEFTAPESGVYKARISRYANRDTASKVHMGLYYEWR